MSAQYSARVKSSWNTTWDSYVLTLLKILPSFIIYLSLIKEDSTFSDQR